MIRTGIRWFLAAVWLVNGLWCKVLDGVPRHRLIVGRVLGEEYAGELTVAIGLGEMLLALMILLGWRMRLLFGLQAALVLAMNILEMLLAPDLLLWGHVNMVFACCFVFLLVICIRLYPHD